MPFKLNHDRRCHIPRQKHRIVNSAAYDAVLRQRGSLTVWFTDAVIEDWRAERRTTPGGQPCYSPLAILTALTLRAVFRLALRQTESLIGSIIGLLGLALAVPDHSTLSRRAKTLEVPRPQRRRNGRPMHLLVDSTGLRLCGAGEWLLEKHGTRTRRSWRKLVWGYLCQAVFGGAGQCGSGGGAEAVGDVGDPLSKHRMPILPFKLNQDRRHHIPRQQHKVTNWPAYNASLRQRGCLTVWVAEHPIHQIDALLPWLWTQ